MKLKDQVESSRAQISQLIQTLTTALPQRDAAITRAVASQAALELAREQQQHAFHLAAQQQRQLGGCTFDAYLKNVTSETNQRLAVQREMAEEMAAIAAMQAEMAAMQQSIDADRSTLDANSGENS